MRLLLLTTLMIFAGSISAGLYKWVDNEGNVHYSQKRPANKQYKRLKAPPPAPANSQPLYNSSKPEKKASKATNKNPNKTVEAETAKNKKIRADNCVKAKKNLNTLQVNRRIRDKDGNLIIIDDNVRAKQIEKAKQAISEFCN